MSQPQVQFSVFTKPWKQLPLSELSRMVKGWGFDGIDLDLAYAPPFGGAWDLIHIGAQELLRKIVSS